MYTSENTTDSLEVFVSCADSVTGKMVYQRTFSIAKNPNELESEDVDNAMVYFPNASQTIPKDCKHMDDNELFYTCD